MLYLITRFSINPVAMQYFHLIIAIASVFLVARCSPFTRLQKTFIVFGYFNFYEYAIISRNYSIGVLFTFVVCSLYSQRYQKSLIIFIILGFLANTNFYAWIISVSFAIVFTLEFTFQKKDQFQVVTRNSTNFLLGLSLYLVAAIGSLLIFVPPWALGRGKDLIKHLDSQSLEQALSHLVVPPSEPGRGTDLIKHLDLQSLEQGLSHLARAIGGIWRSYIPIPQRDLHFWNTNFFLDSSIGSLYLRYGTMIFLVSLMLVFAAIKLSQRSKNALKLYILGNVLLLTFNYTFYFGGQRHQGHFFTLLIACIWIALSESESSERANKKSLKKKLRIANPIFIFFLSIHFLSSIWPYYIDLYYPFTMNQSTAEYLTKYAKDHYADNLIIAGYRNSQTSAFSVLLDIPIYYPQNEDYGSFVIWNNKNLRRMTDSEIINNVVQECKKVGKNCILVLTHKFEPNLLKSYQNNNKVKISHLTSFTGSIVSSESFYIYEISLYTLLPT